MQDLRFIRTSYYTEGSNPLTAVNECAGSRLDFQKSWGGVPQIIVGRIRGGLIPRAGVFSVAL